MANVFYSTFFNVFLIFPGTFFTSMLLTFLILTQTNSYKAEAYIRRYWSGLTSWGVLARNSYLAQRVKEQRIFTNQLIRH